MRRLLSMAGVSVIMGLLPVGAVAADDRPDTITIGRRVERPDGTGGHRTSEPSEIAAIGQKRYRDYFQDCGNVTCTRWIDVRVTRQIYDNRFASSTSGWELIFGVRCASALIAGPLVAVGCGLLAAYQINDMTRSLENAALSEKCLKIRWIRQLGMSAATDFAAEGPKENKKCAVD